MRVVIPGGSGLIGQALAAEVAAAGGEVVVLSRRPERVKGLPAGARAEAWDGASAEVLTPIVDGTDAVVHLAGANIAGGRWTETRKRLIRDSRVVSSRAVAEAISAAAAKPRVLVQASAVGYYGDGGDQVVTEERPPADDFLGRVCHQWEEASRGVEEVGVRRVVIRTGVVLSTAGGALPKMMTPFKLFAGGPVGNGRQWFPWIHVADEAGAIRFLIEREDASGPFNLTAPNPLTNAELSKTLGKVLRRPALLPAPVFALRLAFGEMAAILLEGQRAVPRRLEALGYSFRFPDAEGALRDLLGD